MTSVVDYELLSWLSVGAQVWGGWVLVGLFLLIILLIHAQRLVPVDYELLVVFMGAAVTLLIIVPTAIALYVSFMKHTFPALSQTFNEITNMSLPPMTLSTLAVSSIAVTIVVALNHLVRRRPY